MLKIFISNLKEYNEGQIIGEWVDLPCEGLEEVLDKISNNGNDELFISDYETDISGLKVSEYDNILELNDMTEEIDNLSDDEVIAYQVVNDCGLLDGVPEEVKIYFDYEAYGRDLDINRTFIQIDNSFVELY